LCALPACSAVYIAIESETPSGGGVPANTWTAIYLACVVISAIIFVMTRHLRSLACGMFVILAGVEVVSAAFSNHPILTFGVLFRTYALSILDLIFISAILVAMRFAVLVVVQNKEFVRSQDLSSLPKDLLRAIWLWWPMLVVFLSMNVLYNQLEGGLAKSAARHLTEGIDRSKLPPPGPSFVGKELSLDDAVVLATLQATENVKLQTASNAASTRQAIQKASGKLAGDVSAQIHSSFPNEVMRLSSCSWYDILCHVMNGIKSVVNSVYRKLRDVFLKELDREIAAIDSDVKATAADRENRVNRAVEKTTGQVANSTETAVKKFFKTLDQISFLLLIYSLLTLSKTYLVVLSRVIFRDQRKQSMFARIGTGDASRSRYSIRKLDQEFEIKKDDGLDYYVALEFELRNNVPRTVWPRPMTAIIGRLLSGRYRLGYVDVSRDDFTDATMVLNTPSEFVKWRLVDGEEVVFKYRDLAAFSTNVQLATDIKFSVPALVFGRPIFHKAIGPGVLVFKTRGSAVAGRGQEANESRRSSSLKAWHIDAGFRIQSPLTVIDTFLSPYNIRKERTDNVVYDTAPQNDRLETLGILKSIRVFLLPF
jgi:hypothetical protein